MHARRTVTALSIGGEALTSHPLRTLLATLGVIIGVASLVAVLALGDGMQAAARLQVERVTGVQTVLVTPKTREQVDGVWMPTRGYPVFTPGDARDALAETGADAVSLMVSSVALLEHPSTGRRHATTVSGVLSRADEFHAMVIASGRFFTDAEAAHASAVIVLSAKLARELGAGDAPSALVGRAIRANDATVEVIGVLAPFEGETGTIAYVPFATTTRVFTPMDAPRPTNLLLRARAIEQVDALRDAAEDWAARRFTASRLRKIDVVTQRMRLAQTAQGILVFKLFMAAISGISLVVGGIGIMNVLLASVTERTREIGIRKALGAGRRDVLLQFLAESVAISGVGSAIGVLLGLLGAFGATALIRARANAPFLHAGFSWSTVIVAVASAVFVGLVFGTYPALRASRMSPIDAIRHE